MQTLTKISLYEITSNFENLVEMLNEAQENNDTEQLELIQQGLEITQDNFKDKSLNYSKFIQSETSGINSIDTEIKRLQALKKQKQNKIDYLKKNLSEAMTVLGIDKFDLGIFKLSFRKSSSVEIDENAVIPDEFKRIIPETFEPDKVALKKALEAGEVIEGVKISSNSSLQIK